MVTITSTGLSVDLDKDPGKIDNKSFLDSKSDIVKPPVALRNEIPPGRVHFDGDPEFYEVDEEATRLGTITTKEGIKLFDGSKAVDIDGEDEAEALANAEQKLRDSGVGTKTVQVNLVDGPEELKLFKITSSNDTVPSYLAWNGSSAKLSGPAAESFRKEERGETTDSSGNKTADDSSSSGTATNANSSTASNNSGDKGGTSGESAEDKAKREAEEAAKKSQGSKPKAGA